MTAKGFAAVVGVNTVVSVALLACYALWVARPPAYAVLDVGQLYQLKERQIAALLVKPGASPEERIAALKGVTTFGAELAKVMNELPGECRCLVLARAAVLGTEGMLPDLTPDVARRLGL